MEQEFFNSEIVWDVATFARKLHISMPTAYAMTEEPGFPLLRVGRKKLVITSGLGRWLNERAANGMR